MEQDYLVTFVGTVTVLTTVRVIANSKAAAAGMAVADVYRGMEERLDDPNHHEGWTARDFGVIRDEDAIRRAAKQHVKGLGPHQRGPRAEYEGTLIISEVSNGKRTRTYSTLANSHRPGQRRDANPRGLKVT